MGWSAVFRNGATGHPDDFTDGVLSFCCDNSGHCRTLATLTDVPLPCYRHLFALSRADGSAGGKRDFRLRAGAAVQSS